MDRLSTIKAIARDTLVILALALLGLGVGADAGGTTANLMQARITMLASIVLFVGIGFVISGYRTPQRRWIHLLRVTACAWLSGVAISAPWGLPIARWVLLGVMLLVAMGIGGAISFALRKDPGDTPVRTASVSVHPNSRTLPAGASAEDRISWLKVVGAVLSSNLFLVASCTGISVASIPVMKDSGGKYMVRGEAPDPDMIVIASIPDLAMPGRRKLEAVTLRSLPEFQSTHPDHSFVIPAGSGRIDCNSYRATVLDVGQVRVETAAHCDDMFALEVVGSYEATEREVSPIYSNRTFVSGAVFFGVAGAGILGLIGSILKSVERRRHSSLLAGDNDFEFTRKVGFLRKEWIANYQGHQIRVINSWIGGAKLYIDGALCAENRSLIANPGRPSFSATLSQENAGPRVEVYFEAILSVKAKIVVDGKNIAGDFA